jgi:hypothetical protein
MRASYQASLFRRGIAVWVAASPSGKFHFLFQKPSCSERQQRLSIFINAIFSFISFRNATASKGSCPLYFLISFQLSSGKVVVVKPKFQRGIEKRGTVLQQLFLRVPGPTGPFAQKSTVLGT